MKVAVAVFVALVLVAGTAFAGDLVTGGTKYNFNPGDNVLINYDFSRCPVGEPPEGFDEVKGAPECVKFNDQIWVAPAGAGDLKLYKKMDLGDGDFSIEFSFVLYDPEYCWAMLELYKADPKGWHAEKIKRTVVINAYGDIKVEGAGKIADIRHPKKKPYHVAVQVRRGQFRVFLDGKRLAAISFGLKKDERVSGFALMRVRGSRPYEVLFSNIRVTKYTTKEARPRPEQLGIKVEDTKEGLKLTVPERVLFDFNKFILKPEAKEALEVIADIIREHPQKRILIIGHTDNVGSEAYNLRLSLQRAQSVADYLMYCKRISPERFTIEGKGESQPIADNSTEDGRAQNRRVEIRILK